MRLPYFSRTTGKKAVKATTAVFIVTAVTAVAATLLTSCGFEKKEKAVDVNLEPFRAPSDYVWEGSYIDSRDGLAVLTIEKEKNGGYSASIGVPSEDMSYIRTYEFTLNTADDGVGLSYKNGSLTTYYLPAADAADGSVTTQEGYQNGTGAIYYLEGSLYWIDDVDNAGENFAFAKSEGLEETAETTAAGAAGGN